MPKRRMIWILVVLGALGIGAAVPGSPLYLPQLLDKERRHGGRGTRSWIAGLQSPDLEIRLRAIIALGGMGADAGEAAPALAAILVHDSIPDLRSQAALALSKMAPASRTVVPELAQALTDDELFVRMNAALALFRLGQDAQPAVPALLKAFQDEVNHTNLKTFHFTIHEMIARALGRASAGSDVGVALLSEALKNATGLDARLAYARALGEIGAPAQSAEPLLRALLKDSDVIMRDTAADVLHQIGLAPPRGPAPKAVAALPEVMPLEAGARLPPLKNKSTQWLGGPAAEPILPMGRVAVVDIWAEWCPVCRDAAPQLVGLHKKYKDRVAFVSITPDAKEVAERFVKHFEAAWPCIFAADDSLLRSLGTLRQHGDGWKVSPLLYVVHGDGTVAWNDRIARYRHQKIDATIRELDLVIAATLATQDAGQ